ncbi:MAG: hypothetical protein ABI148_05200 [Ginsengibacter sp.]
MKSLLIIFLSILVSVSSYSQKDSSDISHWHSYPIPSNQDTLMKYNWSKSEWHLQKCGRKVYASLSKDIKGDKKLPFELKASTAKEKEELTGDISFIEVDDGYLVSFWRGEFGGSLYWFDKKGEARKKVARAMIVQFIRRDDKIYAIAGLAHMGYSNGGIIELRKENGEWKLFDYVPLHDAPYAIDMDKQKNFIVVTSSHLFSVDQKKNVDTLVAKGFWDMLYPTSLVVNKKQIFIGMRQGVYKFDLATRKEEWLMLE